MTSTASPTFTSATSQTPGSTWVVVPVKSFSAAKQRLATVLSESERSDLAQRLATGVIAAAAPWPVMVVSGGTDVEHVAATLGAHTVGDPGGGLNAAVLRGVGAAYEHGANRVVIVHADLPLVDDLPGTLCLDGLGPNDVLMVPDRHRDGSNVLSLPLHVGPHAGSNVECQLPFQFPFQFQYGRGSFELHRREARRLGLNVIERRDQRLSLDIDTPDDLQHWRRLEAAQTPARDR